MALLKSLIQRLLDSRTTPAQAAHNASSTYTEPTWFKGTPTVGDSWTDNLYTGTAPSDGYLNVSGSANINTANEGSMIQAKISGAQISQVSPMSGQGFNMMAPISKGATFSVNGIRLSNITVRFFKAIGGGYNNLVRRAVLCLKPSFNFSPRSSFRTNPSGSEANPSRTQLQPGSPFNTLFLINTRLQKTGTSVWEEMLTRPTLVCAVHCLVLLLIQKGIYKDLSPLKKGYLSGFTARQQINNRFTLNSFLCKAANFRTGGALC